MTQFRNEKTAECNYSSEYAVLSDLTRFSSH